MSALDDDGNIVWENGANKISQMINLGLQVIHHDIGRILDIQLNALRCLIEDHNLSSAKLECTLIEINLRQQLEKLKGLTLNGTSRWKTSRI